MTYCMGSKAWLVGAVAGNLLACSGGDGADWDLAGTGSSGPTGTARVSVADVADVLRDRLALGDFGSVRVRLQEASPAVAEFTGGEVGYAIYENGVLTEGELDGVPADGERFLQGALRFGSALEAYREEQRAARVKAWEALGERLGLSSRLATATREGLASASVELTPEELESLVNESGDLVAAVDEGDGPGDAGGVSMSSVLSELRLSDVAFPPGWNGSGVGVFVTDLGAVKTNADCINASSSRLRIYGGGTLADHPTQVVCLVQQAAPEAKVMYQDSTANAGSTLPSPADSVPIYVSSQSVSYDLEQFTSYYRSADRDFDNRALTTRIAHFQLSHNQNGNVRTPGIAYNVLTVGAYDSATDQMASFSNHIDPDTGAYKPELVAPGVNLDISPTYQNKSGTSYATPIAAGFAADLLEQFPWLRLRPALLASYLMVNGVRINTDGWLGAKDGSGRVDYNVAQSGASFWWDGTNSQFFGSSGKIERTWNIGVTGNYMVALSWLVDGNYALANNRPNQDLDLRVYDPQGNLVTSSASFLQTHEVVKFNATVTGNYLFRIERYRNDGGDNVIGLVIRRR